MTQNNNARMHSRAWYGDEEITLNFPEGWTVETIAPKDAPQLSAAGIEAAFGQPIGTPRIAEMARGKTSAAIIVDDLSRPTPAATVIPFLLRELFQAGIPKNEIRFVVGGGSHRPLTDEEVVKKVGADIAAEYEVTSHDFMSGDLCALGNLPSGLPIYINRVVADADFKIALGGIYPHGSVGFGGGAKLIVPGVSGFATMFYFHSFHPGRGHAVIERRGNEPDHRDASEAVAKALGLDVIVNVVINSRREVAGLFVGDFVKAHRKGAHFALETYSTKIPDEIRQETDLVVLNCYPLDSDPIQTGKAFWARHYFEHAYAIALNPASDGICYHGLFDQMDYARFLRRKAEQQPMALPTPKIGTPDQLLVCSEHFAVDDFYKKHPNDILFREWDTLISMLAEKLPQNAKVAAFPCAGIQVLAEG
ncbi:MAG: lactate racemase domain-containing protein [Candidatus Poribacteria bacterium]|nr:lactate racemase domain-containing protein [Candidatus Poribacteria bacterium]